MISRSGHRTEKLFSMGFEILGLETQIFRKKFCILMSLRRHRTAFIAVNSARIPIIERRASANVHFAWALAGTTRAGQEEGAAAKP